MFEATTARSMVLDVEYETSPDMFESISVKSIILNVENDAFLVFNSLSSISPSMLD